VEESTIFWCECLQNSAYSVIVEDDGKVAYAYLREGDKIVADVWLYNRNPALESPEWKDQNKAPFANPASEAYDNDQPPLTTTDELSCRWNEEDGPSVIVIIRGQPWALLCPGAKPGWCRLARQAGPLARPIAEVVQRL